jgi:Skp family chaperone for outer membrane proteins
VLNVKKAQLLATLAASLLLLSLACFDASAQAPPPAARPVARPSGAGNIALLDVSYIFEKHVRYKGMMDDMKADVEREENQVKAEREAIKKLMDGLERFKNTVDYKRMEEDITKRQADLSAQIAIRRKDFLQREAKIYQIIYQEIQQEVDYYCAANGIDMVMRFNGDPVDADKPDSVLAYINRQVVWYAKDRDITPVILARLNERYKRPEAAGGAATGAARPNQTVPFR